MPKLSAEDTKIASVKCGELGLAISDLNILRIATHFYPAMRAMLGTSNVNPPADVHWMQRGEYYIGDSYSANMIISTLDKRGLAFDAGMKYLDFGCRFARSSTQGVPTGGILLWCGSAGVVH
jgi:hypothetical protein